MTASGAILCVRPAGDRAILLELEGPSAVRALHAALTADRVDGVVDIVPGATTLLVIGKTPDYRVLEKVLRHARRLDGSPGPSPEDTVVSLRTRYDGVDLPGVAARCGLDVNEVIQRHSARTYTAAFLGLVPGFAYLTELDPALQLPRRDTPRTAVPPGSVAIASEYTGVLPRSTPSGWHLIATTTEQLWNLEREPPALLAPGTKVRFDPA